MKRADHASRRLGRGSLDAEYAWGPVRARPPSRPAADCRPRAQGTTSRRRQQARRWRPRPHWEIW